MRLRLGLCLGWALAFVSCGVTVPEEGSACTGQRVYCKTSSLALECQKTCNDCTDRLIVAIPCKGPNGCRNGATVTCDMSLNEEGDRCPTRGDENGICTPDGKAMLQCRQGALVKTNQCSACSVVDGKAECTP